MQGWFNDQAGSEVKWLFLCDDSNVHFSVILNATGSSETRVIEEEHRTKGDGRFDG